jgi:pilus assembly protein Flp/PilA
MKRDQLKSQRGQGMTEYAVILSLIAVACLGGVSYLGGGIKSRIALISGFVLGEQDVVTSSENKRTSLTGKAKSHADEQSKGMKGTKDIGDSEESGQTTTTRR